MESTFDLARQFCESIFKGIVPQEASTEQEDVKSVDDWDSMPKTKVLSTPLVPQTPENISIHHTDDGRCVSNITSGEKVLMYDQKTFRFRLTDPL